MIIRTLKALRSDFLYRNAVRSSKSYSNYLRKLGCHIGTGTVFYTPSTIMVDITRPCLISIGNNVHITQGVTILTHGAEWLVLRELYHRPFGSAGKVTIEDNVFVGMHAIILKGVTVHGNSVIGAGSVVTKDVPAGSVVAGNPARIVMSIQDYYRKRLQAQMPEAIAYARAIKERFGREARSGDFSEFFDLFLSRNTAAFGNIPVQKQVGAYMNEFMRSKPIFAGFDEFLRQCNAESGERDQQCDEQCR